MQDKEFRAQIKKARDLAKKGQLEDANKFFQSLTDEAKSAQSKSVLYYNWGNALSDLAGIRNDEALFRESFEKYALAVKYKEDYHEAYYNWGNALSDLAGIRNDEALFRESFEKYALAVKYKEDYHQAYYNWGNALSDLAGIRNDEALFRESFEKYALAVKYKEDYYQAYNNWGNALSDLAGIRNDEALFRESFEKYALAVKYKEDYHQAYNNWGNALLALARIRNDEALFRESFEKYALAVKYKEDYHEAYYNWGNALSDLARIRNDEALFRESFEKYALAVKYKEDYHQAYNNWGNALLALARIRNDEALFRESFEKYALAVKYKEDYHEAYYNWGNALLALARIRNDEALFRESFEKYALAVKYKEDYHQAYNNWGNALSALARIRNDEALFRESFEKYALAVKYKEDDHEAYYNWGTGLSSLARIRNDEALFRESFEKYALAVKYKEDYHKAYNNWGNALSALARIRNDEALFRESFEKYALAVKYKEDYHQAYYNCGYALFNLAELKNDASLFRESLGMFHKAKKHFESGDDRLKDFDIWESRITKKIADIEKTPIRVSSPVDTVTEVLNDLFGIREKEQSDFWKFLLAPRTLKEDDKFLCILRKFNSYTPSMYYKEGSRGGGYFLAWNGKGIVIDPGIGFIDNFIEQGFTLRDLDAIILTHAHFDHTHDLEAVLTLIYELNDLLDKSEKGNPKREELEKKTGYQIDYAPQRLVLFMNRGAAAKFMSWTTFHKSLSDVIILNHGDSIKRKGFDFILKVMKAEHKELFSEGFSTGLLFEMHEADNPFQYKGRPLCIGMPNDTSYDKSISVQYLKCQLLVPHLGTVDPEVEFSRSPQTEDGQIISKKHSHLGFHGLRNFLNDVQEKGLRKLAVISEFEEELKSKREIFAAYFNGIFENSWKCLTGDIGLRIRLSDLGIYCPKCNDYIDYNDIVEIAKGDNQVIWMHKKGLEMHGFSENDLAKKIS